MSKPATSARSATTGTAENPAHPPSLPTTSTTSHRIDATDDRLTNRIDALQSKQYGHFRQHALSDRERARCRERALIVAVGAAIAYLLVVVAVVFTAPDLLASVLIGGVGGVLGVAAGIGVAAYSRSES